MLPFDLRTLLNLSKEVGRIITLDSDDVQPLPEFSRNSHIEAFEEFAALFGRLGLQMCKLQSEQICKQLREKQITATTLKVFLAELQNRMFDECSLRYFFILSDREKDWAEPESPLFGIEVEDKLPSITEDISEAGKCLGLSRATAAVFHLNARHGSRSSEIWRQIRRDHNGRKSMASHP